MKKIFITVLTAITCTTTIAQDQGRYRYSYTVPAEWMAMQMLLTMADQQDGQNAVISRSTARGRVIEEVEINAGRANDISEDADKILETMCLNLLAGRYDGLNGALAMSAERTKMESARENAIREQYFAYVATLSAEDTRVAEDQMNRLASRMVDTKIDWERYAREDTELFLNEQTKTCNQI